MLIGVLSFLIHFYFADITIPFYQVMCAPAILMLSFFSEETPFTPKMLLFLSGQFIGYFCLSASVLSLKRQLTQR
ncbi:hypothetical protein theurythT_13410 [Thalassotalea eurytherma]|uniref:DUF2069 domain-containing protein n=1 Tax=Thalassotalea eurytherma TaxID=1144278 RepID=A0ABQ6H302_9GAMM|nr:hypothetical protein theurythT_13410 [Thalassotalea eurytherma]